MRQNEIVQLNWDSVDLERGFVRLKGIQTKAGKSRLVKLLPDVIEMLQQIPSNRIRGGFLYPQQADLYHTGQHTAMTHGIKLY